MRGWGWEHGGEGWGWEHGSEGRAGSTVVRGGLGARW